MSKVILYIAVSSDFYIADKNGNIEWLNKFNDAESGEDYGYAKLIDNIDSLIMGKNTYKQIKTFDIPWPYEGKNTFVVSTSNNLDLNYGNVSQIKKVEENLFENIMAKSDIWLVGGSQLIKSFLELKLIDEIRLFIMPVFIGEGIPLYLQNTYQGGLRLSDSKIYPNGVVYLNYTLK